MALKSKGLFASSKTQRTNIVRGDTLIFGRVKSIILNETHPRYEELGGWNALGTIEFETVSTPTTNTQVLPTAKPLDATFKSFPLINEIVYILALPNTDIGEFSTTKTNYYISIVGLWNHPHHNAFPQNSNILPPAQQKDYIQTQAGSVRRVTDQSTEIFLGKTFIERGDIHPLLPFEGDKILEGRWGNSIRLGSTVNKEITKEILVANVNTQQIVEKYNFELGGTQVSPEFETKLQEINSQIASQPNAKVSITINAQESRVTNPPEYGVGQLAETRAQTLQSSLTNYSALNQPSTINTSVGTTTYVRGVDNPTDLKYTEEQYVELIVNVETVSTSTQTISSIEPLNPWSDSPTCGDPITIIRNGQGTQTDEGWVPTVEDINNDDTSIYFTSTQKIPLEASSTSYTSYSSNPPTKPNEYAGKQLILNSGRLVFNSTGDHILLSSKETVNINAVNGFNIDSPQSVIQSNSVLLGGVNAVEPVLKGDTTINILVDLVTQLQALTIALQTVTPRGGPAVAAAATQLAPKLSSIVTQLQNTTKSQISKTL